VLHGFDRPHGLAQHGGRLRLIKAFDAPQLYHLLLLLG
jgi:hypothetical protein